MILAPIPLGGKTLARDELERDKKACRKIGPCGLGSEALYLGGRYIERRYYLCWREVRRVFKRVAMSKGGFTGKGIFGSMAYLVVQYGKGQERSCYFKREDDLDRLLEQIEREHPRIPTHSVQAEKKLAEAAAAEQARYAKELSPAADEALARLRRAKEFLENNSGIGKNLAAAAKQKRIVDGMKPAYRIGGIAVLALSVAAAAYGLSSWLRHGKYGMYFLLGGVVFFLFTLSTNTLPGRWNNKKAAQKDWDQAVDASRRCLAGERDFPVPAQYAHPIVIDRMIRVVREGRAETEAAALSVVKDDLRALNSSVTVSQKEHDEVVAVKPLFLVCDYRDEI